MKRVESLDLLRAFAALSVFFYHIHEVGNNPFNGFFNFGGIGVDLFFVLSGFFISLSIIKNKDWDIFLFFKKRINRIIPAYYVSLIILLALVPPVYLLTKFGLYDVLSHLIFIHPWNYQTHGSINGAYWSLGVEVQYYILIALSAIFLRSKKYRYYLLISWIVIAWLWRFNISSMDIEPIYKFILSTQVIGMLDEFSFGIIIAIFMTSEVKDDFINSKLFIFLVSILMILGFYFYSTLQGRGDYWSNSSIVVFGKSLLALSFSASIIVFIKLSDYVRVLSVIHYTGIPYIGRISYSFYLYHLPVMLSMAKVGILNENDIFSGFMCLIITILISSVSYYLVEKRFYKNC